MDGTAILPKHSRLSEKYFVFLGFPKILFQHGHMGQKGRIIKILGPFGALADAPLTLDAGAWHIGHILRINSSHGTQPGTGAAVRALGEVRLGLGFQELGRLAVRALGHVIGCCRVAGDLNWVGDIP